ncbi:MAG: hypothetical protein U1F15_07465 [Burkholderiales bacterium]
MSNVPYSVALALALAVAPPAFAQTPAGGAAKCGKVDAYPGRTASPNMIKNWNKETATWQDCMKKYIADMQAKTDESVKATNALIAETNAAIALYNDTVKDFQAQVDGTK